MMSSFLYENILSLINQLDNASDTFIWVKTIFLLSFFDRVKEAQTELKKYRQIL